ncbi:MAG: transcription termination factor NusA [Candidatus Babeliales bacterium]
MNLTDVIEGLVEERGLDREKIIEIVSEGIKAAYIKRFPTIDFEVSFNRKSGNLEVFARRTIVSSVADEEKEVSLRRAKILDTQAKIGQVIPVPFEEPVGRIEILTAKQIIAGKIRDLEQLAVFEEFKDKKDSIVTGNVHKRERAGFAVKVGEVLALLPLENIIPNEPIKIGHPIRVLLQEVYPAARGDYQLILDRASADFVKKLIEAEIPEVFEGLVEIKRAVRIPGYKTKVLVSSTRKEIDPVGTCVGIGGARIKPILRELGQEKVDLIQWSDSSENLVRSSLKPAEVDKVEFVGDDRVVVWLAPDQRSFAIGRMGQNINLASQLVGLEIKLQDLAPSRDNLSLYDEPEQSSEESTDLEKKQSGE